MTRKKIKVEVVTKDDSADKRVENEVAEETISEQAEGLSETGSPLEDRSAETPSPAAQANASASAAEVEAPDAGAAEAKTETADASSSSAAADAEDILEAAAQIVDDAAADEAAAQSAARIEELETSLAAAKQEAADAKDRHVRLQAEWDNYRKRTTNEREAERLRATERLVKELLPVIDDMERAITYTDADAPASSVLAGITAIRDKMLGVLAKEKVSPVDPTGQPFDALIHQAVGRVEDDSVPDETVMQVYQKGYDMAGRCIRPAMVTVSSGGPARDKE
ncbi:MAG: nucleotide exchange factor GrpE [Coriobacteriales bacterium]|nr:nucleotide exchange factor GrpE [Coriobacteriales bacterium]